jgi:adenylyltransferase/sulfurtransferase
MPDSPALAEIDVHELKRLMDSHTPFVLLDVREPGEYEVARLPDSVLIPLGELPQRLSELDASAPTIIHCKAGGRSAKALALLVHAGFTDACHLKGGINAWSQEIDPAVPYY